MWITTTIAAMRLARYGELGSSTGSRRPYANLLTTIIAVQQRRHHGIGRDAEGSNTKGAHEQHDHRHGKKLARSPPSPERAAVPDRVRQPGQPVGALERNNR